MPAAERLRLGEPQLFLDDRLVARKLQVVRAFHQAVKHPDNPLVAPDRPWENNIALIYGDVIRDPGGPFRMWYFSVHPKYDKCCCVATSEDGLRWTKPALDLGAPETASTNIIMSPATVPGHDEWAGVIRDPGDPDPQRRYKAIASAIHTKDGPTWREFLAMTSPDGVRWSVETRIPAPKPLNPDISHLTWDPVEKQYVLWARSLLATPANRKRYGTPYGVRAVHRITSRDFRRWSGATLAFQATKLDPFPTDCYSMAGFRAGPHWIGLAQMFDRSVQGELAHTLQIQLAHSRDGLRWDRPNATRPVLPIGGPGEWDRFNQSIASNPVRVGDELWLYYGGRTCRHNPYKGPDNGPGWTAIGLATFRLDGFCSLDASFQKGQVLTRPLSLPSADLWVNAAARWGSVTVEALDAKGQVLAASQPLQRDAVEQPVRWTAQPPPVSNPVQLRFTLSNARLYSYWAGPRPR